MSRSLELASALGAAAIAGAGMVPLLQREPAPDAWFSVQWPRELPAEAVLALLRHLAASRRPGIVAFEVRGTKHGVEHRIGVSRHDVGRLMHTVHSFVPDALLSELDASKTTSVAFAHAVQLRIGTRERALRTDGALEISRSVVSSLAQTHTGTVVVQWLLGPRLRPRHVSGESPGLPSTGKWLVDAVLGKETTLDARARTELRNKVGDHGFQVRLCVATSLTDPKIASGVLRRVVGALKVAEAPGAHLRVRKIAPHNVALASPPRRWSTAVNVGELVGLLGWPLGDETYPGVTRIASRRLPVSKAIPAVGRVIGEGNHPQTLRRVALDIADAQLHTHFLGQTGVGKTTAMANLILQDIEAGRGVVVIEPKGDLVADVLARIPMERELDVVVIDPTDERAVVGLNPLAGGSPGLVADQLLAVFRGLYGEALGPRTSDILHAGLLTLCRGERATLVALPLLLTDARLRRELTAPLLGDLALGPFWSWYEGLSEQHRDQVIAPLMNKVRRFLHAPTRLLIGQVKPRFDIAQVFTKRKILLVPLNKGTLGAENAGLIGSLLVAQLWQAAQSRATVAPSRRHPVSVVIDEFQDFLHLPTDLADVLAQSRSAGLALHLSHQHLAQLTPDVRAAVLTNARNRVCFRLSADDAAVIARTTKLLDATDFQNLGRYEIYTALVSGGAAQPFCSATTRPLPRPTSDGKRVRALSREQYGRPVGEIEKELRDLVNRNHVDGFSNSVGKRKRGTP